MANRPECSSEAFAERIDELETNQERILEKLELIHLSVENCEANIANLSQVEDEILELAGLLKRGM